MTKGIKNELIAVIAIIQSSLSRQFGLSDDCDPNIIIGGVSAANASAHYSPARNELAFRPSMIWQGTIAHELAHWLQFHLEGDTDCLVSSATDNDGLQFRHDVLQKQIREHMKGCGWENEIDRIMG